MKIDHLKNRRLRNTNGQADEAAGLRPTLEPSHSGRINYDLPAGGTETKGIDLPEQETLAEGAPRPAETPKAPRSPKRPLKAPATPEPQTGPAEKPPTVYLDHAHIDFAQDVTRAGTLLRPRVSISAAAMVRYALDELRAAMTPEKAYAAIVTKAAEATEGTGEPGEKRPRITAYVNAGHRQYVDDVVYVARSARARSINASTVYRFAVDRLQEAMGAEQVCEAIASKPIDPKTPGRKRR